MTYRQLTLRGSVFISTLPYVRSKSLIQAMTPWTHSPVELECSLYMTRLKHTLKMA